MKNPYKAKGGYIVALSDSQGNQYDWFEYRTWEKVLEAFEDSEAINGLRILASAKWYPTSPFDGGAETQPYNMVFQRKWTLEEIEGAAIGRHNDIEHDVYVDTRLRRRDAAIRAEIVWQKALQGNEESFWQYGGKIYACK